MKPRIGIIPGEPGGIGPELIAKLLNDTETCAKADILLIGDQHLFEQGQTQAGMDFAMTRCDGWKDEWTKRCWARRSAATSRSSRPRTR